MKISEKQIMQLINIVTLMLTQANLHPVSKMEIQEFLNQIYNQQSYELKDIE